MWSAETVFVCALALLGRTEQNFPAVQFVANAPAGVSAFAEAYTQIAEARIVLVTSTSAFAKAQRSKDRCGDLEAIREVAGVLAHEEWHVHHGPGEPGAYDAQLTALSYVGAGPQTSLYHKVVRSKQAVRDAAKRAAEVRRLTRGATQHGVDPSSLTAAPGRRGDSP